MNSRSSSKGCRGHSRMPASQQARRSRADGTCHLTEHRCLIREVATELLVCQVVLPCRNQFLCESGLSTETNWR